MKRVLIITYYWPPSGGGGVMRWLKMSKYLPEFGWKPIIYTPENPDASVVDSSLLEEVNRDTEVIKSKIWEPYDIYRKLTGKKKEEKFKAGYISEAAQKGWKNRLSVFIRGNLLIPDPRMFWIYPSVKFICKYLENNNIDLIISTGPPHSMHLIALYVKRKMNISWIADFRDPWTDIDFYSKLNLTKWADRKHHKLEKRVLEEADKVVTVSPDCAKELQRKANKNVNVVYNGYDEDDFKNLPEKLDTEFTITHFGAFNRDRNPGVLWRALADIVKKNREIEEKLVIKLIGQTDEYIIEDIKKNNLNRNLKLIEHLPHKMGLRELAGSQILLLPINKAPNAKGILPGKMYEYMALKRPIIAIGPGDADFVNVIKMAKAGQVFDYNDLEGIKKTLLSFFDKYKKGQLYLQSSNFMKYSRKNQAKEFMKLAKI